MFKKRKIKNLIENIAHAETKKEEQKILSDLSQIGVSSIEYVIEAFQKRKLIPSKARFLLDELCDDSSLNDIITLIGNPYDEVRRAAKNMIINRWRKPSVPLLIDLLTSDNHYSRTNAAELLVGFKDQSCVAKLITLFNGGESLVKRNIIRILTRIRCDTSKKLILSAINDESVDVCLASVKSLGEMKAFESVDPLIEKLHDSDYQVKKLAIDALIAIEDKQATVSMIELLKDNDMIIRQKATEFLIEFADSDIVPKIIGLLSSDDVNVRRCVVEVLNNLKDPNASNALMKALKDSDWWVRQIATESLITIKGDNIVKGFKMMLKEPDENLKRCAVEFFNNVTDESSFEFLLDLLNDPDWWIREKTITALGKLKNNRAVSKIAEMINDGDIKSSIPGALAEIGGDEAVSYLKEFLLDESKIVRIEVLKAFEKLKAIETVSNLKECLNDPEIEVSTEAVRVLKELTGKTYKVKDKQGLQTQSMVFSRVGTEEGSTLTEAIVVVDLCNSTEIASKYGDSFSLNLLKILNKAVNLAAKKQRYQFIKGTGDGSLITFPKISNSVHFALNLFNLISNYNKKVNKSKKINLRIAIHFGETNVNGTGDRLGTAVNMAFRVEGANSNNLMPIENGMTREEMPLDNYIFVTEIVAKEVQQIKRVKSKLVGLFELKGITGLHRIFQIT